MNSRNNRIGRVFAPALAAGLLLGLGQANAHAAGYTTADEMLVTAPRVIPERVIIAEQVDGSVARLAAEFGAPPAGNVAVARGDAPGTLRLVLSGYERSPRG